MWTSDFGAVESEREPRPERSHLISPAASTTIARWGRLIKDPLFVVLFVWACLFLVATVIFVEN